MASGDRIGRPGGFGRLRRYSTHHDFRYPQYGKKARQLTTPMGGKRGRQVRRASRAEDSAGALYDALNVGDKAKRRRAIKKALRGEF